MTSPTGRVSGHYAGAFTRLGAFVLDWFIIVTAYGMLVASAQWLLRVFFGVVVDFDESDYAYDFALNYCAASWESDTEHLPCPGFVDSAFESFTRSDPARSRDTGGSGLGLAIAQGFVAALGGEIWAEPGPGGRVGFHLPAGEPRSALH